MRQEYASHVYIRVYTSVYTSMWISLSVRWRACHSTQLNLSLPLPVTFVGALTQPLPPLDGFIQFFLFASLTWTACLIHMLSAVLVNRTLVERYSMFYHVLTFGISVLGAALAVVLSLLAPGVDFDRDADSSTSSSAVGPTPESTDDHGHGGIWCWADSRDAPAIRFLLLYGPLVVVSLFCLVCYLFTVRMLNRQAGHHSLTCASFLRYHESEELREAAPVIRSMRFFLLILTVCWSWGLARDLQQLIDPDHPVFWLTCAHGFFAPLQGFLFR
jgi:hypothetical protein